MKDQFEAFISAVRSARRFRWVALLVTWTVGILGALAVLLLPNQYQSRAQIFVDTRTVLRPLLQGLAVSSQTQDQTDVVRRALLARPSLDKVARNTGLYKRANSPEGADRMLTELGDRIFINGDSSLGIYTITYSDSSPKMSLVVVQNLLDTFVQRSLGAGRADTQSAERFLTQQVADYEARLSESERQLADFKKKNLGNMPDQRGDSFVRLQAEIANLEKVRTDLAVEKRQRDELRGKISGTDSRGSAALQALPTSQEIQLATALDARIRDAKRQVDDLLLKFTEHHPDVQAAEETLRALEKQREVELGSVRATNGSQSETSSAPVDPVIQNLQIALNGADVQVAALETQEQQAAARVTELRQVLTTGPEVEAELARLNRDYGVTKVQYEALLQRLESAKLSNDADRSEDLRFKILEPPRLPIQPVSPNRLLLLIGVLVFSVLIGGAVAFVLALTQPVFFSKKAITSATGLPVIGVVSRARTPRLLAAERRASFTYASFALLLITAVTVAAVFNYPISKLLQHLVGLDRI
jgi:polysaccharide chain length determinant protein (PEP-CTERM system associated)